MKTTSAPWAYFVCAMVANPHAQKENSNYITGCSSFNDFIPFLSLKVIKTPFLPTFTTLFIIAFLLGRNPWFDHGEDR